MDIGALTGSTSASASCKCIFYDKTGILRPTNANLYHYAGNNPVKYTDPDGNADWERQLFEQWSETEINGYFLTEQEMFNDMMTAANQQFSYHFQQLQSKWDIIEANIEKGVITGMRFMADNGSILSLVCYASGHAEIGVFIDGISLVCDISFAAYDFYKTRDVKSFAKDLTKIAITELSSKAIEGVNINLLNKLKKDITKQIPDNIDRIIDVLNAVETMAVEQCLDSVE